MKIDEDTNKLLICEHEIWGMFMDVFGIEGNDIYVNSRDKRDEYRFERVNLDSPSFDPEIHSFDLEADD